MLSKIIGGFGEPTDDHGVCWSAGNWARGLMSASSAEARNLAALVEQLSSELPDGCAGHPEWHLITRSDVFARNDDPLRLFLATMAWGYGNRGLGWPRVRDIASADSFAARIDRFVKSVASVPPDAPAAAWTAVADNAGRPHKVHMAFGSKLAYFAAYDRTRQRGPLIADIWAAWGFWTFWGSDDRWERSALWDIRTDCGLYVQYVAEAETWAAEHGHRSDDIERALFTAGPHAKRCWDKLHEIKIS
ncbi:MAG: hypothetical protein M0030_23010 [Actinomycetota bacterium]|nr:hypothetical protein [Actinomycetota bacterium]